MPEGYYNPRPDDDDSLFQGKNWVSQIIVRMISDWTPKCTEMTHLISGEMDHPLPWFVRFKMRVHYLMCCYCERYRDNLHYMRSLMQRLQDRVNEVATLSLSFEEKERMKRVLREELESS
jgi:hypothetical protein